jgi:hypothetical protein
MSITLTPAALIQLSSRRCKGGVRGESLPDDAEYLKWEADDNYTFYEEQVIK